MWYGKVSNGGARTLVFSPDARTLYTGDAVGQVTAWDAATGAGRRLVPLTDPHANGRFFLSPDGRHLRFRNGGDGFVVRDAGTGAVVSRHPLPAAMRWLGQPSPDGRYYLCRDSNGGRLRRWDWEAGAEAEPIPVAGDSQLFPDFVALHTDGATAARYAGFGPSGSVVALDGPTRAERWRARAAVNNRGLAFDPTGARLLAVHQRWHLTAFETATGGELWAVRGRGPFFYGVECVAFHPTRPLVAVCFEKGGKRHTGAALFLDLDTGAPVAVPDPGFPSAARVAFSPDGLTCAVAGTDRQFAVFDLDG